MNCGQRRPHLVAGKSPDGEPGAVAEQPAERHLLIAGELTRRKLPGMQIVVDILVQAQLPLLDEREQPGGEYRLADRSGQKERGGVDGFRAPEGSHAKAFRPDDTVAVDDRDADAGHMIESHSLDEVE